MSELPYSNCDIFLVVPPAAFGRVRDHHDGLGLSVEVFGFGAGINAPLVVLLATHPAWGNYA